MILLGIIIITAAVLALSTQKMVHHHNAGNDRANKAQNSGVGFGEFVLVNWLRPLYRVRQENDPQEMD